MIEKLSQKCTRYIIKNSKKDCVSEAVYQYGLNVFFSSLLAIVVTILIGVLAGHFGNSLFYLIMFCVLRRSTGGYHATKCTVCRNIFWGGFIGTLIAYEFVDIQDERILFLLLSIGLLVIVMLAPVGTLQNPIPMRKHNLMKKSAIITNAFQLGILLIVAQIDKTMLFFGSAAVFFCEFVLAFGAVNYFRERKNNESKS